MDKRRERIERFKSNAEVQRKFGDLQGCLEFRELAEELEKLEGIEQIVKDYGLSETDLTNDDLSDFEKDILREVLEKECTCEKQND